MDAFTVIAGTLKAGLELWNSKERTKYTDRLIRLETERYEEKAKPRPDHAVLDRIEFDLFLLCRAFTSEARGQATPNQP
jgi:hypothetical protein